jgi:hypothetical protein
MAVVDLDGDRAGEVLLGTPGLGIDQVNEGGAVLYDASSTGPADAPAWSWQSDIPWLAMGCRVAAAGDLDGDGHADALVAGPDDANDSAGGVFLFPGEGGILAAAAAVDYHQGEGESDYGAALAGNLDLDGDGAPEFAVGAPGADDGSGRVFVYDSSKTAAAWERRGSFPGQALGRTLASGDVDGDGYADVAIAAQTSQAAMQGAVHVYLGAAAGLADAQPIFASDLGDGSGCGDALAVGDLDADGFADIAVGCPLDSIALGGGGAVLLLPGSSSGISTSPSWVTAPGEITSGLGTALAITDFDADGFLDLAAGAPYAQVAGGSGSVALFSGATWGATTPTQVMVAGATTAGFGDALAAGDLDANGQDDLLVADSYGAGGRGQVFAFLGNAPDRDGDGDPDALDCDDEDPAVNRFAVESDQDQVDNDCDGVAAPCMVCDEEPSESGTEDTGCGCGDGGRGTILAAAGAGLALLTRRRTARYG